MKLISDFDEAVAQSFIKSGYDINDQNLTVGAAVSGGADSVSLLVSLVHIFGKSRVRAVNVNHRIRPRAESDGDTDFVRNLCLSFGVQCYFFECEEGFLEALSEELGLGIEEAARFKRYEFFGSFLRNTGTSLLCLAHNKNDQLETVLMRFLQGSDGEIKKMRGKFFRPLLDTDRAQIEEYLRSQGFSWRTDSTNQDNNYYRNRIRNELVPCLDRLFQGWRRGVLSFAEKNAVDAEFFEDFCSSFSWEESGADGKCVCMDSALFYSQKPAVRRRLVFRALSQIGSAPRVPYKMIRPVLFWKDDGSLHKVSGAGAEIFERATDGVRKVFVAKTERGAFLDSGFYFLIRDERDLFDFCANFFAQKKSLKIDAPFPFVIRSFFSTDKIIFSNGRTKSVVSYFSEKKIPKSERGKIPFLQECGKKNLVKLLNLEADNFMENNQFSC